MAKNFINYIHPSLIIKAEKIYIGNYKVKIKLTDDNPIPLSREYEIIISIIQKEE